jgi:hypothetical protein
MLQNFALPHSEACQPCCAFEESLIAHALGGGCEIGYFSVNCGTQVRVLQIAHLPLPI